MRYEDPINKILNNFTQSVAEKLLTVQPIDIRKENAKIEIDILCEFYKSYAQTQEEKNFLDCQAKIAKQQIDNQK